MKFTEMTVDEFKKDFKKFLEKFSKEELVKSLKKYSTNKEQYVYNYSKKEEYNYNISGCNINFEDNSKEYKFCCHEKYGNANVHIEMEGAA